MSCVTKPVASQLIKWCKWGLLANCIQEKFVGQLLCCVLFIDLLQIRLRTSLQNVRRRREKQLQKTNCRDCETLHATWRAKVNIKPAAKTDYEYFMKHSSYCFPGSGYVVIIIDNRGLNTRWCLTPLLLSLPTAAYLGQRGLTLAGLPHTTAQCRLTGYVITSLLA